MIRSTAMQYDDFELEIGRPDDAGYQLAARSAEGEQRGAMRLPFDEQGLERQILALENAVLRSANASRRIESPALATVREFGQVLFESAFDRNIRSLFDRTLAAAERQGRGVRLKLRILSPELSALPWEFLYNPDRNEHVCLLRSTPLVRYIEIGNPIKPLVVEPPLRILGVAANSRSHATLDIEHEKERMDNALRKLRSKDRVELHWLPTGTWRELQATLRRETWHVLHFVGHGGYDEQNEEGLLILADDEGTQDYYPLPASKLADLLRPHPTLRFVLLNSCEGARASRRDIFASTAATLVRRGVPAVLAMQYEISDKAAIEFSRSFYESLADGTPVDAATSDARVAISFALRNSVEWGTPVLFTHSLDGALFTPSHPPPPAAGAQTAEPAAAPATIETAAPPPLEVTTADPSPAVRGDSEPAALPVSQPVPAYPLRLPKVEWHGPEVLVRLLISIGDSATADRVRRMREKLLRSQPVYDSKQMFRFSWQEVEPAALSPTISELLENSAEQLIVLVSDGLAERGRDDRPLPGNLTATIRERFLEQPKLCGLVALFDGPSRRTADIERVVDRRTLTDLRVQDAVLRTADALRLKAPPGPTAELADNEALVVRLARDEDDLRACLRLRFDVYDRLFYLEERISDCPARLDVDLYDTRSLHFLAESSLSGDVVGTVRLVLPRLLFPSQKNTVIGSPAPATVQRQARLCQKIADDEAHQGNTALADKLGEASFAALPILQSNDFREKTAEMLANAKMQTELSRLIVQPHYRGLGVSRLLIRAVVAAARDIERDIILLECVPAHAGMYAKHGFTRMQGHHGRVQDLDQLAVAMSLQLTESPLDQAASLARRDLEMIRSGPPDDDMLLGTKHLCLCNARDCWYSGAYGSRTKQRCPLRQDHLGKSPDPH
jgi:GNAT superfamily N-acetyltransferase